VLDCSGNLLSSLDFTKNPLLTDLNCSDNSLVSLNIKNGNNVILNTFDARTNPALTCIAVDDETQIGGDWQKDAAASYADNCNPGSTFVPDDNFENALIALGLDSGPLDNYVTTAAIDTVTNLDISGENIEELTGIEGFSALESLDCSSNLLFSLDISQNISLTSLTCFSNFLNQLDVQSNTALVSLNCGNNRLATLDVSQNTGLEELIVDSNQLTEVDVMSNGALLRL
ncbi:MAG: chromosome condensation regulator RCC1, partial [Bacteroidota bacterium]